MIAMGQLQRPSLGYEAAGLVRRVGPDATRVSPGDRVLYIGPGAMRTNVRCHELAVHKLPDKISLEDGVAIPIAYATAYQSLVEVARLQPAESVLIHAAAGGEFSPCKQVQLTLTFLHHRTWTSPDSDCHHVESRDFLHSGLSLEERSSHGSRCQV